MFGKKSLQRTRQLRRRGFIDDGGHPQPSSPRLRAEASRFSSTVKKDEAASLVLRLASQSEVRSRTRNSMPHLLRGAQNVWLSLGDDDSANPRPRRQRD